RARCSWSRLAWRISAITPASVDAGKHPVPAQGAKPGPRLEQRCAGVDRNPPDFGAADEILLRHIADAAEFDRHAAVLRIIPIVAHHEEVMRRDRIDAGIVAGIEIEQVERVEAHAIRQRLFPLLYAFLHI